MKSEIFLEEIAYGLRPQRHEGKIAPYGCLFRSLTGADPEGTRIDVRDIAFLRVASDGRRTFVVYPGIQQPELFRLSRECETELDLVHLAERAGSLALRRTETGLVSLVYEGRVYTVRGREWYGRPPIEEMSGAVTQACPGSYPDVKPLLELCCYVLSPKNIGATFVMFLREPTEEEGAVWSEHPNLRPLALRYDDQGAYAEIVHLARHHDGAFLIGPDHVVRSLKGHLVAAQKTHNLIREYRGTRHTSAMRYSFEHPNALVFVVSEDGNVSVFSDGALLATSPVLASVQIQALREKAPEIDKEVLPHILERVCPRCEKRLSVQKIMVTDRNEDRELTCPICALPLERIPCWKLLVTPLKLDHKPTAMRPIGAGGANSQGVNASEK